MQNPAGNFALEEYLLRHVADDEVIMYLWRNEKTVVIGRHQNVWAEVNLPELSSAGGHVVRRLSGGGAVYHDLGNLNFTFVAHVSNYDVARQTSVILEAVRSLGFDASLTGRNDLCVDGRKFSGHSFYKSGDRCFHNGTILLDTDPEMMQRVLNVSAIKLQSKGVKSVRARTVNLCEIDPSLECDTMINALCSAFEAEYGMKAEMWDVAACDELEALESRFCDHEWTYNRQCSFTEKISRHCSWGNVDLQLKVERGVIVDCDVFTDALDTSIPDTLKKSLVGSLYDVEFVEKMLYL